MFDKRIKPSFTYKKIVAVALAVIVLLGTSEAVHSVLIKYFSTLNLATVDQPGSERGYLKELERNVEAIGALLDNILIKLEKGGDFSSEMAGLRTSRLALQSLDVEVRRGFGDDEGKLRATGVSQEIMDRHREIVKSYGQKFEALMSGLAEIEELRNDGGKLKEKVIGLLEFVKKLQPERTTTAINMDKLPFRPEFKSAEQTSSFLSSDGQKVSALDSGDFSQADLSETMEVKFTQEIRELAANLSYNPVKMYEYVRNNFDYEIYYGSLKGAQETLWEMAGNDFDLASLLIALYRVSGIPARYVYGSVEVPIERVMNWVGVTNRSTAADMFATGAIPSVAVVDTYGVIKTLRMDHAWVEAYVDYIPSRGAVNIAGDTWVQLDPSFKQYMYVEGVNFTKEVPYDFEAFLNRLESTATINEAGSYFSGFNASVISEEIEAYHTQVRAYVEANMPNITLGEVLGGGIIVRQEFGILPATLPYNVLTVLAEYVEVPDDLRHKVTFEVQDEFGFTDISYTLSLPEVAGKRITLSYLGATVSDEELIKSYENATVLPAYLINLKPVLRIDGEAKVSGSSIGMGSDQQLILTFMVPNKTPEAVQNTVLAGAYWAIGLDLQRMPTRLMEKLTLDFEKILADNNTTPWKADDVFGEILFETALFYWSEADFQGSLMEKFFNVATVRDISLAIVSADLNVSYSILGTPYEASLSGGFSIDVDRSIVSPFPRKEDGNLTRRFTKSSGSLGSALEHFVFEHLWSGYNVRGISAIKALVVANEQGIPIFGITSENLDQILPQLEVNQLVKDDIINAIYAGKVVTVPQREITLGNWTGSGYVIEDPNTGAGAYMISGRLGGGGNADPLQWLWNMLPRVLVGFISRSLTGFFGVTWSYWRISKRLTEKMGPEGLIPALLLGVPYVLSVGYLGWLFYLAVTLTVGAPALLTAFFVVGFILNLIWTIDGLYWSYYLGDP